MKLLLVGSTGLVGSHVLHLALAEQRVQEVLVLTRRALNIQHPKLRTQIVDFENLPEDARLWHADAVICTLGTTMRIAGSKAAFRRVDYAYPLAVAKRARQHHTPAYVLNSALGANPTARIFYNQVKGELERDLTQLGYPSLSLIRPGLIGGAREQVRLGEQTLSVVLNILSPLLPRRWHINPAPRIAQALIEAALEQPQGTNIVTAEQLI
ncbi:NAD-dependent epimerase/dehydratase family protein [Celerinatantimonas yamalensis]|uniref:NAD-dependent epimerase/dehydratase family protein n=1 Tax=Celerinatantimonas yamalensis TaxID=559956 RepID=A0ABW9G8C9_9GAMM